jgi:hypothetical protein
VGQKRAEKSADKRTENRGKSRREPLKYKHGMTQDERKGTINHLPGGYLKYHTLLNIPYFTVPDHRAGGLKHGIPGSHHPAGGLNHGIPDSRCMLIQ